MDVHKPKAAHSWREFGVEIGTIVIGVLIALGAEQAVEQLHWRHQTHEARELMKAELRFDAFAAYQRLVAGDCLKQKAASLHRDLLASGPIWRGAVTGSDPDDPPLLYKAPWWQWSSQAYEAAVASGALSHMRAEEASNFSGAYALVREARANADDEEKAVAELSDLSYAAPINDVSRQGFLRALGNARFDNLRSVALSREMLRSFQALDVRLNETERTNDVSQVRKALGACAVVAPYPQPS